jgi:hypothetical protein
MIEDQPDVTPSPWLVVVEPKLHGLQGHYLSLALGCLRAARRRGFKTLLACGLEAPGFLDGEADSVQRVFAPLKAGRIPRLKGVVRRWRLDQGCRAIRPPADAGSVTMVFTTFAPELSWAIYRTMSRWPGLHGMIVLYHENPPPARLRFDYKIVSASKRPVVHGVFDRSFRKGMKNATGIRHVGVPHPFSWNQFNAAPDTARRRDTILFAGALRINKGAKEIVDIIRHILPDVERLGFRVLCYAVPSWMQQEAMACQPVLEELERLRQLHSSLVLRTVAASDSEMKEDYRRAAVTVLSYHPEGYRHKTSGILMEATVLGSPVVASRGTYMERMISRGHAAGLAVDYHDREAWRRSIVQILESAPEYQAAAASCSAWWRNFWTGDRFLRHGLKAIDAVAAAPGKRRLN